MKRDVREKDRNRVGYGAGNLPFKWHRNRSRNAAQRKFRQYCLCFPVERLVVSLRSFRVALAVPILECSRR